MTGVRELSIGAILRAGLDWRLGYRGTGMQWSASHPGIPIVAQAALSSKSRVCSGVASRVGRGAHVTPTV